MSLRRLVVTCEHGGNEVPPDYAPHFTEHQDLLDSHRGWDPGALELAREMAAAFSAPLVYSTTSRLLIDLNRSIGHRRLYSEATRPLPAATRRTIVAAHYRPHRDAVMAAVEAEVAQGHRVVHVASHSFTPALDGVTREADVACLYDPRRPGERVFCAAWLAAIDSRMPGLRLRRNYPYHGKDDGLITSLRKRYTPEQYVGMELEVNQRFVLTGDVRWPRLRDTITRALGEALDALP